jgi:hypothetical protein
MVVGDSSRIAKTRGDRRIFAVALSATDLVDHEVPEALAEVCRRDLKVSIPADRFREPPVAGGQWRIVIDGIDEIIDSSARSTLIWKLKKRLRVTNGHYQFLVMCRPLPEAELADLRQSSVDEYELKPFDRHDLDEFASNWFAARLPSNPAEATNQTLRFLTRIAGARLGPVARVPLLATIAALVFERGAGGPLPSTRAALYGRFVNHLLDGRHELSRYRDGLCLILRTRGRDGTAIAAWLDADFYGITTRMLEALGAARVEDPDAEMYAVALDWCQRNAPRDIATVLPDWSQRLKTLLLSTGLFTLRRDRMIFAHQSFAEFFAARQHATTVSENDWLLWATNPAARSLASFIAARRHDAEGLVSLLLERAGDAAAAGDLLADGVPVSRETRTSIVDLLVARVRDENDDAVECLRVLRELSVDGDVLRRLAALASEKSAGVWTRVIVADAIADVDPSTGLVLLRNLADNPDKTVRDWISGALESRGYRLEQEVRFSAAQRWGSERRPLGRLARHALAARAASPDISDDQRVAAAALLAENGDVDTLRALLESPELSHHARIKAASALADHGDYVALTELAAGSPSDVTGDGIYYASPLYWARDYLRFGASVELFRRGYPEACELLGSIVEDCPGKPMAYVASAMVAKDGNGSSSLLVELAVSRKRPKVILTSRPALKLNAIAAGRHLAYLGDQAALTTVAVRSPSAMVRDWAQAGLFRTDSGNAEIRRRRLVRGRGLSSIKFELWCFLANAGDPQAKAILRRWSFGRLGGYFRSRRRRIAAAYTLAVLGEPGAVDSLQRIANTARYRTSTRVYAGAALAQVDADVGLDTLRRMAAQPNRPEVRLAASWRLAHSSLDFAPLHNLIIDENVPTHHRARAVEMLGPLIDERTAIFDNPDAEVKRQPVIFTQPYVPREWIKRIDRLPDSIASKLVDLVGSTATHPQLRIAIAGVLMSPQVSVKILTAVANESTNPSWPRVAAAKMLLSREPGLGWEALVRFARERHVNWIAQRFALMHILEYCLNSSFRTGLDIKNPLLKKGLDSSGLRFFLFLAWIFALPTRVVVRRYKVDTLLHQYTGKSISGNATSGAPPLSGSSDLP